MKISIIIPTYQPGDYLYECLGSLKNQDFLRKDFEIIIVLNGIRHPYENNILNHMNTEMSGVLVNYIYTGISGVSNARNIGIDNADGEYILFVDDDDLVSANYLKELYNSRVKNGIMVSNVGPFVQNISNLSNDYLSNAYASNKKTSPDDFFKLRSFLSTCWGKLIPRELILDGRFYTDIAISEDSLFMFLVAGRVETINLCSNSDVLYYRRLRPNSASRKKKSLFLRLNLLRKLLVRYTAIYVKNIPGYSFKLYLSRIAGSVIALVKLA
ncbi:MAG: glycosyltransferase family 2 protein [Syntrophorhabdaceae bacterium]|nr:glycosyltransferase family 2 protein [Syntrophorhabdaceae bacterium]